MKKKIPIILLAVVLILALSSCAIPENIPERIDNLRNRLIGLPNVDVYTLYAIDLREGHVIKADGLFDGDNFISLQDDGYAGICLEDRLIATQWSVDDTTVTFATENGSLIATLKDGVITLPTDEYDLYFVSENTDPDFLNAISADEAGELLAGPADK